ncbi:MAG: BREX-1 system phosphatase PglZ type B [Chloroflexi bacterium]|nr:BREX-1 system phosphatase PglZ type B [Chloroflexota bacterium]
MDVINTPASTGLTFLDKVVEALKRARNYNHNDQTEPVAVLWTDKERQWEKLLPLLREKLPILTFGKYQPETLTGPAYWLRCMLERTLPGAVELLPDGTIPIIYLPGLSKAELRAVEECPKSLQPLAELQYRGIFWNHKNGKEWTVAGFLQASEGGLSIETGPDNATKEALLRALLKLTAEPVARLRKEAPLRAAFFDALLNPDEVKNLLQWLNDPSGYVKHTSKAEWDSFCGLCQRKYSFHPEKDGDVTAAALLGEQQHSGWKTVWQRFAEAPQSYPHLLGLLRRAKPQQPNELFPTLSESWPQDNETAENRLRESLLSLKDKLPEQARAEIASLEQEHSVRRTWVWAKLNQSPLVAALEPLFRLAQETGQPVSGTTLDEVVAAYSGKGWQADAAMLDALAGVETGPDVAAVKAAITALYRPWLQNGANAMQKAVQAASEYQSGKLPELEAGTCLLFSDGLRFDVGQKLATVLEKRGLLCQVKPHLSALPTVTATAKPAISPVASLITGEKQPKLEPAAIGGSTVNITVLQKLLQQANYQVLKGQDLGEPSSGKAWTECGAIDVYGHTHEWKLARHIKGEILELDERINSLLNWGWQKVIVVTDHGWLLLPGGLPKAELPEHLTVIRKGRCARLKEGSATDQQKVGWHWDKNVLVAFAPGICCYEAGKEYEHGGLSPQECIVPVLTVSKPGNAPGQQPVNIESIVWRRLRCTVKISGDAPAGVVLDIRTKANDSHSSLIQAPKSIGPDGTFSVLVTDEELEGNAVHIVLLSAEGKIIKQATTTVGG